MQLKTSSRFLIAALTCIFAAACGKSRSEQLLETGFTEAEPQETLTCYDSHDNVVFEQTLPARSYTSFYSSDVYIVQYAANNIDRTIKGRIHGTDNTAPHCISDAYYIDRTTAAADSLLKNAEDNAPLYAVIKNESGKIILSGKFSKDDGNALELMVSEDAVIRRVKTAGLFVISSTDPESIKNGISNTITAPTARPVAVPTPSGPG